MDVLYNGLTLRMLNSLGIQPWLIYVWGVLTLLDMVAYYTSSLCEY